MAESVDDSGWLEELEKALLEDCDFGSLRNISKGRPVPENLRADVWKICLNVQGKGDGMANFDGLYDMPEQTELREDCRSVVDRLGNEEEDKVSVVSDLESIVTFFCKSKNEKYVSDNGWLEIIQPLFTLKDKGEIYNCFYSLVNRYIPRDCKKNGKLFHLFRLLLQYHDPELCSFLDTKRITPDIYGQVWFRSLFAAVCDLKVILNMWDVYFQQGDQFLVFFMALVILVNARDQLLTSGLDGKKDIIDMMSTFPAALEADDIEDFCSLSQYYASRTPQSFRRDYQGPLFGCSAVHPGEESDVLVSQVLCLPVSVNELLQANQLGGGDGVRYFVVDCRPAEQYNAGHLPTAFHLDANLMLQNPEEFNTAVHTLIAQQKQALSAGSAAGGEHLCFMGSGREEEDQYVHMVVANFLQKNHQYISVARGGYSALHQVLLDNLDGLADHNQSQCICCQTESTSSASDLEHIEEMKPFGVEDQLDSLLGKLSSVVKSKSAEMKEKLTNYIKNEHQPVERHVSSTDRVGKPYRNMASVFTIGDDDEGEDGNIGSSDEEGKEVVSMDTWLRKPDVVYSCQCHEIVHNGYTHPSYILVTGSHLFILREMQRNTGMAQIQARRALGSIVKITSKKRHPEFITFKYGSNEDDGLHVTDYDRFVIPKAGEATKAIKQQIMKVLEALES
ncbi:hypothetical protein ScPMuIL_003289 [Solemya velum]